MRMLFTPIKPAVFAVSLLLAAGGCDMKKDIDLPLPAFTHQPVVECYLENGQPVQLLLTETSDYFDSPLPEGIEGATITITRGGITDTLTEIAGLQNQLDTLTEKAYNYKLAGDLQVQPGETFSLVVKDPKGRTITGTTTFKQPVPIDTIRYFFQGDTIASVFAYFTDPAGEENYYRFMVHRDTPLGLREDDDLSSDRISNGQVNSFNTRYNFHHGDTLVITLYNIEKQYYDFLRTVRDANQANGNPFAQPTSIQSTVSGGMGVFTNLSYYRTKVIVP